MQFFDESNIPANLAERSFAANLFRLFPAARGGAPLFGLTGMAKELMCSNTSHGYWLKSAEFPKATVSTAIISAATATVVVNDTSRFKVNSLLRFRPTAAAGSWAAPEVMQVLDITSATELSVQRGAQGTTALADIPAGSVLIEIGSAYEQGSLMPSSRAILPEYFENRTSIFRDAWDASETLNAIKMETGYNSVSENKKDASFFHAQAIETQLFFGKKSAGTKNGKTYTTMNGIEATIEEFAPSNLITAGATTSYDDLEAMLNPLLDSAIDGRSSNDRTIFVGSKALQVINNIGRKSGEYTLEDGQTTFGLQFNKFKTSRGHFSIIEHPLFNTNDDWKSMACVMDLPSFDVVYLRKTKHKDVAHDGRDAQSGVFTSELTNMMLNPSASGIIYGLTAAAV